MRLEDRVRTRREMLATDRAALESWCDAFDAMKKDGAECVVGSEKALETCSGLALLTLDD